MYVLFVCVSALRLAVAGGAQEWPSSCAREQLRTTARGASALGAELPVGILHVCRVLYYIDKKSLDFARLASPGQRHSIASHIRYERGRRPYDYDYD